MNVFACPMCMMIGAVLPKIIGTKKVSLGGSGSNFKPPSFNKSLRHTSSNRVKVFNPPSELKPHK